jgi:hypothetical protein
LELELVQVKQWGWAEQTQMKQYSLFQLTMEKMTTLSSQTIPTLRWEQLDFPLMLWGCYTEYYCLPLLEYTEGPRENEAIILLKIK